jgi:hypothetical protein
MHLSYFTFYKIKNTKTSLGISFKNFDFKNILVILLCITNAKTIIYLRSK